MSAETVGQVADIVRSKNAGPFWVTLDIFCSTDGDYKRLADEDFLTPQRIGALYGVPAEHVKVFRIPALKAIKLSYPRPVGQASPGERDVHAGQQFVPLARLELPR